MKSDGTRPHQKARSTLDPGERLTLRFGGGGGYGRPEDRDPDAVRSDLRNGYITPDFAKHHYDVDER